MRVFSSPHAFMMFVMLLSVGGAGGEAGVSPARDIAQKAAEAVVISGGTGLQTRPATAWGDTDLLVVWEDKRSGGYDIYGARIDATGKVLDPAGIPIGTATGDQTMPAVAWGNGAWLVVWTDNRLPDVGSQIYAIRVGADGKLIDSDAHLVRNSPYNPQSMPSVAWSGKNFTPRGNSMKHPFLGMSSTGAYFLPAASGIHQLTTITYRTVARRMNHPFLRTESSS